jgi:hypothetical protein
MTGLIYFLILFFIFLISYQLFLAYFSGYLEGLTNNTSSTTTTNSNNQAMFTSQLFSKLALNPSIATSPSFASISNTASQGPQTTSDEKMCMSLLTQIGNNPGLASTSTSQLQNCSTIYQNIAQNPSSTSSSSSTSGTTGNVTTATTTTNNVIAPTASATTINASAINSGNIAYVPYTSTSESVPSLVGQNTNNILYLKEKMDNLFQQVQDVSGNLTSVNTVQSSQAAQFGKVNNVVSAAQNKIQQLPTPQVKGLN